MNVAFFCKNSINTYSGGRIHALKLASAFSKLNHNVTFYTNCIPIFDNDLKCLRKKSAFYYKINKIFLFYPQLKNYQIIIIVPHLASKKSFIFDRFIFYPIIKYFKKINQSKLWFLDFESPNWIDPELRNINNYRYSNKIIKYCNIILSTTKIGSDFAKKYYVSLNKNLIYKQLYLSINSKIAAEYALYNKENRVAFFMRNEKHKNSNAILNVIEALPKYFTISIFVSNHDLINSLINKINNKFGEKIIKFKIHINLKDKDKFEILAKSKILFFSSNFEGYGLPPIEAQFVNTPVICSDLAVLREVNTQALFVDYNNIEKIKNAINQVLITKFKKNQLQRSVYEFASYNNFINNLKKILSN